MKADKESPEAFDKVTSTSDKLLAAGYHSVFSDKREGKKKNLKSTLYITSYKLLLLYITLNKLQLICKEV